MKLFIKGLLGKLIKTNKKEDVKMIDLKVNLINLTPHDVNIIKDDGNVEIIKASGKVARYKEETKHVIFYNGIAVFEKTFGDVFIENIDKTIEDMPIQFNGEMTRYIVSNLVMSALPNRNDLVAPNDMVRDEKGKIIGCKSFSM